SPEQAKGFEVDPRTDTFSFGSVLYEMLTGRQAFHGETVGDVLASVIAREPEFGLLPPNPNPRLQELLQRCLQKNPKRRWQAVGELRAELEIIAQAPRDVRSAGESIALRSRWRLAIPILAGIVIFSFLSAVVAWRLKPTPPMTVARFAVT